MYKLKKILTLYFQKNTASEYYRNIHLNATKMILFLSINMIKSIDQIIEHGLTAEQKYYQCNISMAEWHDKRCIELGKICDIIQLPLEKLWNESIVENQFVEYVFTNLFYTLFPLILFNFQMYTIQHNL